MSAPGKLRWVIAEGYLPPFNPDDSYELRSHEAACILNAGEVEARISITIFFTDREPIGPYRLAVPPRRTVHLRFNDLVDPAPIPVNTPYSSLIESDQPVVVQHTRLDSRQAALLSTIAYGEA